HASWFPASFDRRMARFFSNNLRCCVQGATHCTGKGCSLQLHLPDVLKKGNVAAIVRAERRTAALLQSRAAVGLRTMTIPGVFGNPCSQRHTNVRAKKTLSNAADIESGAQLAELLRSVDWSVRVNRIRTPAQLAIVCAYGVFRLKQSGDDDEQVE